MTIHPIAIMNEKPLSVPYWLPRLKGKPNWADWRRNVEEAFYEVEETGVYWDIIMDKADLMEEDESMPSREPPQATSSQDPENFDIVMPGPPSVPSPQNGNSGSKVYSQSILNIRARQILASSLEPTPNHAIERISDAHEAYLKLEALYGDTSAQSIFVAWEKLIKVKYYNRNPCDKFIEKFKSALEDVKDQAVELTPTVSLALFLQAIKAHSNTTNFMANIRVSIYEPDFMDTVYEQFLKDQAATCLRIPQRMIDTLH